MLEFYEKHQKNILKIVILLICLAITYYFGSIFISATLPFVLAWGIAFFIEPLIRFLQKKLRVSRSIAIYFSLSLLVGTFLLVIFIIGGLITIETIEFSSMLSENRNYFYDEARLIFDKVHAFYNLLPKEISQSLLNGINILADKITLYMSVVLSSILSLLTFVPEAFVFLIVTIIAAFFFARDKEQIQSFVLKHTEASWREKAGALKKDLLLALMGYIKAQLILMTVTFSVSIIGLYIVGIEYAAVIALIVSLIDALPILGVSAVYLPMIVWNILQSDYSVAVYISIVYVSAMTIRQLLEPKVLGKQIGIHPLLTLVSMYVGLKTLGVLGLIIGPVAVVIVMAYYKIENSPDKTKLVE